MYILNSLLLPQVTPIMHEEEKNGHWTGSRELHGSGEILQKYDFPQDERTLGGAYTVEENAHLLLRYFLFERLLLRAEAGWLMGTPEFEVKVEYGRHIYYHSEAAMKFRA